MRDTLLWIGRSFRLVYNSGVLPCDVASLTGRNSCFTPMRTPTIVISILLVTVLIQVAVTARGEAPSPAASGRDLSPGGEVGNLPLSTSHPKRAGLHLSPGGEVGGRRSRTTGEGAESLYPITAPIVSILIAQPEKPAIAPRTVTLNQPGATLGPAAAEIAKQTGIPIAVPDALAKTACPVTLTNAPFWQALEAIADRTGNRIALSESGRKVGLEPRGKWKDVSSVAGPFRTVVRGVTGRSLFDAGVTFYDVALETHWEPRFPVFRIDTQPTITTATDDRGTKLTASPGNARTQTSGSTHDLKVRLSGLTRDSRTIATLAGFVTVTAAEKMLAFKFDDLTAKLPATKTQDRVTVTLKRVERDEATWEVELELTYPPNQPVFESFEEGWWTAQNQLRLVSPDASKSFTPDDYEMRGRVFIYRFKEDPAKGLVNPTRKGWSLVYETPSPLVEFRVPFTLKDIPLP